MVTIISDGGGNGGGPALTAPRGIPQEQGRDISIHLGDQTGGKHFVFPVGLEGLTFDFGSRAVTTQALDAFWCDALGPSVPTCTLSGHTGWRPLRDGRDGKQQFAYMLKMHQEHMGRLAKAPNSPLSLLLLHDPTSGLTLRCFATNLRIIRDKTRALLFQFEWQLTIVKTFAIREDASQDWTRLGTNYALPTLDSTPARPSMARQATDIRLSVATTAPGDAVPYTVRSGDTFSALVSALYRVTTADQIAIASDAVLQYPRNSGIVNPNYVYAGEVIWFPKRIHSS